VVPGPLQPDDSRDSQINILVANSGVIDLRKEATVTYVSTTAETLWTFANNG